MLVYVGDDGSEDHHDVHLMNEQGESLAARRLPEGLEGMTALHELLAQHAQEPAEVVIGIETRPWSVVRRAPRRRLPGLRHQPAGSVALPRAPPGRRREVRQRRCAHARQPRPHRPPQPPPGRGRQRGRLRCAGARPRPAAARLEPHAREQPAPERAAAVRSGRTPRLPDLTHADALSVLAIAPEPGAEARLSMTQLRCAPRRGGRTRNVERRAAEIRAALRVRTLEVSPAVREAFAHSTRAEVAQFQEITASSRRWSRSWRRLLRSTRTPPPTSRCRDWAPCSAPGCWASSGTTPTASCPRSHAETTRAPRRSPEHRGGGGR